MTAVTLALFALTACSTAADEPAVSIPVEITDRQAYDTSDFCRRMLDLERSNPSVERVIREYRSLLDSAPTEIAAEMAAVLADLTGDRPPVDTGRDGSLDPAAVVDPDDPDRPEGLDDLDDRVPAVEPDAAQAVATYLDENCRSTAVNPLPGPTDPP